MQTNNKNFTENITGGKALAMLLTAMFFYCYQYVVRTMPNVLTKELGDFFELNRANLGSLVTFGLIFYVSMQMIAGYALDKYGIRKSISLAALLCGVGTIMFFYSNNYTIAAFGRSLGGAGSAFAFIGSLKVINTFFDKSKASVLSGLIITLGTGTAFAAGPIFCYLFEIYHWRDIALILGVFGIALSFFIYMILVDKKVENTTQLPQISIFETMSIIMSNKQCWLYGFCSMALHFIMTGFADLWGTDFIQQKLSVTKDVASLTNSMYYIGLAAGGPIFGCYSDFIKSRKKPLIIGITLHMIFFSFIFLPMSLTMMRLLMILIGLTAASSIVCFIGAMEDSDNRVKATVSGFINMTSMFSGVILQPVMGAIVGAYPENGYYYSFALILGIMSVALIMSFYIKDNIRK